MRVQKRGDTPGTMQTRCRFEAAIRSLADGRPPESITLAQVCARAGMGRHTFFQAFASLGDAKAAALAPPDWSAERRAGRESP